MALVYMSCAQASERGWGKEMEEAEGEEREEKIEEGGKKDRGREGQEGGKRGGESSRGRESSIRITEKEGIVKASVPWLPRPAWVTFVQINHHDSHDSHPDHPVPA